MPTRRGSRSPCSSTSASGSLARSKFWWRCTYGLPVSYADALVVESLGQAVRAAAFLVPGAVGVQEVGFIAVCAVYGIPAAAALALSLVKRVPEIVLGLPFLFAWHVHEARAMIRRGSIPS